MTYRLILSLGAVMILPKGDTLFPMGSTHPFEMQCWVQEGAKPVWTLGTDPLQTHDLVPTAAEKYENRSLIFISTTGNYSYISITDEGFEMYTSVNGSAKLHIGCIPHQSCFACPSNETAILQIIVLFATPGVPEDLKVSTDSGFLTWTRPENMLPEIPLTYEVLVKDLETGEEVAAYENMTEQSLSIKVPRYYNVSVTASCVFCKVGQTAIAFLEPGTSHILSARIEYVEDCLAVCIICTFEKSSPATACHVTDGIRPFIIQKGQDMCVEKAKSVQKYTQ
jgi:hypothetical protein